MGSQQDNLMSYVDPNMRSFVLKQQHMCEFLFIAFSIVLFNFIIWNLK